MPEKKTKAGRKYEIVGGRRFVWHADVWEDEGEQPFDVTVPLRIKLKVLDGFDESAMDAATMRRMLAAIVPDQSDALGEMDVNDLQAMFSAWQTEYNALNGATLGESGR